MATEQKRMEQLFIRSEKRDDGEAGGFEEKVLLQRKNLRRHSLEKGAAALRMSLLKSKTGSKYHPKRGEGDLGKILRIAQDDMIA